MRQTLYILLCSLLSLIADAATMNAAEADELPTVSLITVGQGAEAYQLEGHTALRLRFTDGRDVAVNWGVFDYATPNFAYRFVKGETDYSIGVCPFLLMVNEYRREGRYLGEQVLDLTPAESQAIVDLINDNLKPENRVYRYNYVLDNCATRPLAIIEKALDADSASLLINQPDQETTFRKEMRNYHRDFPAYQMFIDYALGSGLDRQISAREQAYAPIFLEKLVASADVVNNDGAKRPLVSKTVEILPGPSEPFSEKTISPWIIVIAILLCTIAVTIRDQRRKRVTFWFDAILYGIFGLLGLLLAFLIFISLHEATSPNINFLWLNPLCLIVPVLAGFKKCRKVVFCYQIANFVAIVVLLCGIPFFTQSLNILFLPLILSDLIRSINFITLNRR